MAVSMRHTNSLARYRRIEDRILSLKPAAYWPLSAATISGPTVYDISGGGFHGVATGAPVVTTKFNGVSHMTFDGTDDVVDINDNDVFTVRPAGFSWFFYVNPILDADYRAVITKGSSLSGNREWTCSFSNSPTRTTLGLGTWVNLTSTTWSGLNMVLPSEQHWHCVAYTVTGNSNATMMGYVNGTLASRSEGVNGFVNSAHGVRIGWTTGNDGSTYFKGGLAHVAMFPYRLSSEQIRDLARYGPPVLA